MNEKTGTPIHEKLIIGLLLAFVGGYLDAFTYVLKGGVFANAQTGNVIFLSLNLASGRFSAALNFALPILAFALGILGSELLKKYMSEKGFLRFEQLILLIETALVIIIGLLPVSLPFTVYTVAISFFCALLFNTFRKLENAIYATTFCTGNLRSAVEALFAFFANHDRSAGRRAVRFLLVLFAFGVGAVVGAALCNLWGQPSLFVCSGVLLIAFLLTYVIKSEKIEH